VSRISGLGDRVLIAWDGGVEAARAVRDALPVLQRATRVDLVIFNLDELPDIHEEAPADDITQFLRRHGVQPRVVEQKTEDRIGDALLALAGSLASDLLVMGCYGHSRLREIVLGGTTKSVLRSTHLPLLMAH
jgi:nucleotide-binding universal stress UspA family protein